MEEQKENRDHRLEKFLAKHYRGIILGMVLVPAVVFLILFAVAISL